MNAAKRANGRICRAACLAAVLVALTACATAPRPDKPYFASSDAGAHTIHIPSNLAPKIAVAGFIQRDRSAAGKQERDLTSKPTDLSTPLTAIAKGLSQNPTLKSSSLSDFPFRLPCPEIAVAQSGPKLEACALPDRLEALTTVDQLRSNGYSHLLLFRQEIAKDAGATQTTWGIGPGIPMFTSETVVYYTFTLSARVYDLLTGTVVTEVVAADADIGYHGVMMIIYPFYSAPDEERYAEAMGHAVGAEIARRFRRAAQ